MRTFVSLDIPEETKREIHDRYVNGMDFLNPPKDMHLTLLFIESIRNEDVAEVSKAVEHLCCNKNAFLVSVCGAGEFGGGRVVFLKVTNGFDKIIDLHSALCEEIEHTIKLAYEERAFFPHITFGRPSHKDRKLAVEYVKKDEWPEINFLCGGLSFFESRNEKGGYVHILISASAFSPVVRQQP